MRNKRLDVLRCVAVITVIIHHSHVWPFFTRTGWAGVDLFFVLSGFLISGLLFSEYKKRHAISFKRFFIRRGLKIYPAFYVFLLLTGLTAQLVFHNHPLVQYLHDIFFIMDYKQGFWDHTWTLAVEEQFYIFLPIVLLVVLRFSPNRENPFRPIPWAALSIALFCIISRGVSVNIGKPNFKMAYTAFHNRMDALFFGVLIGYLYHFHPASLEKLMRPTRNRVVMAAISAGLLSFAYFYDRDDKFFATFGYSFVYLGFAGVLLLSLYVHGIFSGRLARLAELAGTAAAFVGKYSYSIYLWHGPGGAWLPGLVRRATGFPTGTSGRFAVYFVGSLVIGTVMSKLVEYPILRLRDRIVPDSNIVPVAAEVGTARDSTLPDAASILGACSLNPARWIALLGCPDKPTDGVEDYCTFLARALQDRGTHMDLVRVRWMEKGWFLGLWELWLRSAGWRGQWVFLQYTALSWSRRGIPFGALATLAILRRRGVRCAVVFHEPSRQSQFSTRRIDRIRGACQDWVIRRLYNGAAKAIFTSPVEGIGWLRAMQDDRAAFIPIGANIPERVHRRAVPGQAGTGKTVIVFGVSDSPETAAPEVNVISAVMLEASHKLGRLRLVVLGRGALEAGGLLEKAFHRSDVDLEVRGVLHAVQVADEFESADALLFVRGPITTRRGSAMAGIACGVPIVGYRGPEVNSALEAAGVEWCTWQDHESLTRGLIRVLSDPQRWSELHERNLEMQKNYFSWNRIAERFQEVLAP